MQGYLDKRWSPEQIVHELAAVHGRRIAVETIYRRSTALSASSSAMPASCCARTAHIGVRAVVATSAGRGSSSRSRELSTDRSRFTTAWSLDTGKGT